MNEITLQKLRFCPHLLLTVVHGCVAFVAYVFRDGGTQNGTEGQEPHCPPPPLLCLRLHLYIIYNTTTFVRTQAFSF